MNSFFKIILFVIFSAEICILSAQESNAILSIQTNIDSAGLFIDNEFKGIGRTFEIESTAGIHIIQVVAKLKKWNAELIVDTIDVQNSENLTLNYNFKSQVFLNSNPEDVRVFKNDSLIGFTPLIIESGFSNLKLEKPNYTSLNLTSEEISEDQMPKLQFNGEPPKKEFYGSLLFNVLLGTAIAFGAATAYYKIEADDLYDQYKITGDPGLIDNIDHYDDQSAGTLIGMEICVGALIYFFLTN